jgi:tryptophan 2,3-dioxygenase
LTPEEVKVVEAAENEPTLHSLINDWLERTPGLDTNWFDRLRAGVEADGLQTRRAAERIVDEEHRRQAVGDCASNEALFASLFDEAHHNSMMEKKSRSLSHQASKGALMIYLLRDQPRFHLPFNMMSLLQDIDGALMSWRHNHTIVVQRIIGAKPGSGGSSGYQYLRSTVSDRYKVFKDLSNLATFIVPRDLIPDIDDGHHSRLNTYASPTRPRSTHGSPRNTPSQGSASPPTIATSIPLVTASAGPSPLRPGAGGDAAPGPSAAGRNGEGGALAAANTVLGALAGSDEGWDGRND